MIGEDGTMGNDMLVNLYALPEYEVPEGIRIKQVFPGERQKVLDFIREHYHSPGWEGEAGYAMLQNPVKCFIAVENGEIVGFACYDSTALGYFGPIGLHTQKKGKGIGRALLLRTLYAMKEYGYGYAVIGWVDDAEGFYRKTVNAVPIPGGTPENTAYQKMTRF